MTFYKDTHTHLHCIKVSQSGEDTHKDQVLLLTHQPTKEGAIIDLHTILCVGVNKEMYYCVGMCEACAVSAELV